MESAQYMAKNGFGKWMAQNNMVCVTIYASNTDLFTEDEIDELVNSVEYYTEMIDIPVPKDLLFLWWMDEQMNNPQYWGKHAWMVTDHAEFDRWLYDESTADDTETLYYWLKKHNYCWKRLD